jgi:hypothetical protein
MQDFKLYFGLGTEHILTPDALDHLLFVTALCLRYLVKDWKKVVVLVTAFTIGHSVTLALSATGTIQFPTRWIEFLIPLTIVATAFNNLWQKSLQVEHPSGLPVIYFFALFFGLIHGLAYANTFLSLEGRDGLLPHLLAFNLGIEAAQLLVVAIVLAISFIFVQLMKVPRLWWIRIASVLILLTALKMAWGRWPERAGKSTEVTTHHSPTHKTTDNTHRNAKIIISVIDPLHPRTIDGSECSKQPGFEPWQ